MAPFELMAAMAEMLPNGKRIVSIKKAAVKKKVEEKTKEKAISVTLAKVEKVAMVEKLH
jgi:hypothetical protein